MKRGAGSATAAAPALAGGSSTAAGRASRDGLGRRAVAAVAGVAALLLLLLVGEYVRPSQLTRRALGGGDGDVDGDVDFDGSETAVGRRAPRQRRFVVGRRGRSGSRRARLAAEAREELGEEDAYSAAAAEEEGGTHHDVEDGAQLAPGQRRRRRRAHASALRRRRRRSRAAALPPPAEEAEDDEGDAEEAADDGEAVEGGAPSVEADEGEEAPARPSPPPPQPACRVRRTREELVARFGAERARLGASDEASYAFIARVASWQREAGRVPTTGGVGVVADGNHPNPPGGDTAAFVLDIGANTGQYVDAFRRAYGGDVHVHSFEPLGVTHAKLVELKAADRKVHVRRVALTDFVGNVTFYSPPISSVKNDLLEFPTGASIGASEDSSAAVGTVPADTLDRFLAALGDGSVPVEEGGLPLQPSGGGSRRRARRHRARRAPPPRPLFVKIDVEGADAAVLRGANATLASGAIEALQFETNFKLERMEGGAALGAAVDRLAAAGYDVYILPRTGAWHPISGPLWDPAYAVLATTWDATNLVAVRARPPVPWHAAFRAWALGDDLLCQAR
jgi:FkbM family methyltransferase